MLLEEDRKTRNNIELVIIMENGNLQYIIAIPMVVAMVGMIME